MRALCDVESRAPDSIRCTTIFPKRFYGALLPRPPTQPRPCPRLRANKTGAVSWKSAPLRCVALFRSAIFSPVLSLHPGLSLGSMAYGGHLPQSRRRPLRRGGDKAARPTWGACPLIRDCCRAPVSFLISSIQPGRAGKAVSPRRLPVWAAREVVPPREDLPVQQVPACPHRSDRSDGIRLTAPERGSSTTAPHFFAHLQPFLAVFLLLLLPSTARPPASPPAGGESSSTPGAPFETKTSDGGQLHAARSDTDNARAPRLALSRPVDTTLTHDCQSASSVIGSRRVARGISHTGAPGERAGSEGLTPLIWGVSAGTRQTETRGNWVGSFRATMPGQAKAKAQALGSAGSAGGARRRRK